MNEDKKALKRRLKILDDLSRRQPTKPKDQIKNWIKTYCPSCKKKIEYFPKKGWKGDLKCPHCGYKFRQTLLKEF